MIQRLLLTFLLLGSSAFGAEGQNEQGLDLLEELDKLAKESDEPEPGPSEVVKPENLPAASPEIKAPAQEKSDDKGLVPDARATQIVPDKKDEVIEAAPKPTLDLPAVKVYASSSAPEAVPTSQEAPPSREIFSAERPMIGEYKIKLGVSQPTFGSGLSYYDDLYGDAATSFTVKIDYYFLGTNVPFGLGVNVGYSQDTGHAAKTSSPVGSGFSQDQLDLNQELMLVLIPFQINAVAQWPLFKKYLVLDFWAGLEQLYVQESRHATEESGTEGEDKTFVNSGMNQNIVFGGGLNIRIDGLESRSYWSLRSMGIQAIYLTPYFEMARASSTKMGDFSRSTLGLLFSFETF